MKLITCGIVDRPNPVVLTPQSYEYPIVRRKLILANDEHKFHMLDVLVEPVAKRLNPCFGVRLVRGVAVVKFRVLAKCPRWL